MYGIPGPFRFLKGHSKYLVIGQFDSHLGSQLKLTTWCSNLITIRSGVNPVDQHGSGRTMSRTTHAVTVTTREELLSERGSGNLASYFAAKCSCNSWCVCVRRGGMRVSPRLLGVNNLDSNPKSSMMTRHTVYT